MPTTSARLLSLLSLLQARRDWPGPALADRLKVSARTVRRDVDRLRELGYAVSATKGPDGGYRLEAGTELPPLLFDDEQAVALAVALQLASTAGAGIEEAAARALTTVRQVMPAKLRHQIDSVRFTPVAGPDGASWLQADGAVLRALSRAVSAREVLRFDYAPAYRADDGRGGDGRTGGGPVGDDPVDRVSRRVQPHHLVAWGGRWYLLAWDLDRDGWRTFRADRVTPRTPTGPSFTPRGLPGGDVGAFVLARFRGAAGWPCHGEVVLDLPAEVVAGYTRDGVVEALGPNRCRLVSGSWSWPALAAALGRFDADLEVVEPAELKDAFTLLARRFANAGTGPTPPEHAGPAGPRDESAPDAPVASGSQAGPARARTGANLGGGIGDS